MVKLKRQQNVLTLILQPNRSASWQQTKHAIILVTLFVMMIALIWTLAGAWLILPFAGLEAGLLAFLMYRGSLATYQKQVITIYPDKVIFQAGLYYPQRVCSFNKASLLVTTTEADTPFEHSYMCLADGQKVVPFGQFLNQPDRLMALQHFKQAKLPILSNKWWKEHTSY
ncbi:DUF2244 domain-containing protein [Paraglaciecola aestuariivivens]